jgi:uncharacterized protein YukE
MTVIRMNTEDVRTAAWQVDQAAGDLYLKPSKLRSAANSLSGLWQGGKSSKFTKQIRALATQLKGEVISLQRLAKQVQAEVVEWEETDRTGFQVFGELQKSSIASFLPLLYAIPKYGLNKELNKIKQRDEYFANGVKELLGNKAYKGLVSDLEKEGLGLRLPDKNKTIVGSKKGKIIDVEFYDDPKASVYGGYNPGTDRFRIDTDPGHLKDPKELADTLAHEMQHAIDDKKGLLNSNFYDAILAGGDKKKLETILQREFQKKLDTEARAFTRGDAIKSNISYIDDGKISVSEVSKVPTPYLADWGKQINELGFIKGKFTARVTLNQNQLVVTLDKKK